MTQVQVTVDVDVELNVFDTQDLIDELERRGKQPSEFLPRTGLDTQRQAMLRSLWAGDDAKTIELLKNYLCDCLGRATI